MKARSGGLLLALGLMLGVAVPALAHHSLSGQFVVSRTITLTGVISKVDWINPHIYLHLDVKEADGKPVTWRLEGVPVAMARKAGLSKVMLQGNGEQVTVIAHPARGDVPHLGFLVKITYPDGRFYQLTPEPGEAGK